MSELHLTEVAGLPVGGPATLADLKSYLRLPPPEDPPTADDLRLEMYVEAVNAQVRLWPTAARSASYDDDAPSEEWWRPTVLGSLMLATRLEARRNSPEGVATFAAEGPVYVSRNDPDIGALLETGSGALPTVG